MEIKNHVLLGGVMTGSSNQRSRRVSYGEKEYKEIMRALTEVQLDVRELKTNERRI